MHPKELSIRYHSFRAETAIIECMDSPQPQGPNRWWVALAGLTVMLCLGTIYSRSLFARPLAAAFRWSSLEVSMVFAASIFALGTGAVVGGRLQDKVDPRAVA